MLKYQKHWKDRYTLYFIDFNSLLDKIQLYYKIRHEAKTAYSQNTIQSLKTYNIIKSDALHKT